MSSMRQHPLVPKRNDSAPWLGAWLEGAPPPTLRPAPMAASSQTDPAPLRALAASRARRSRCPPARRWRGCRRGRWSVSVRRGHLRTPRVHPPRRQWPSEGGAAAGALTAAPQRQLRTFVAQQRGRARKTTSRGRAAAPPARRDRPPAGPGTSLWGGSRTPFEVPQRDKNSYGMHCPVASCAGLQFCCCARKMQRMFMDDTRSRAIGYPVHRTPKKEHSYINAHLQRQSLNQAAQLPRHPTETLPSRRRRRRC